MTETKWATSTQTQVPKSSDGETSTDGLNPLDLPLILRHIFINLQPLDLINCSEVNKMWNYEARSVLRDFKTCVATNKGHRPCRSLRELDAELSRMTIMPYNGLRLRIPKHCQPTCTSKTASLQFRFLKTHFKLKVLKIDWDDTESDSMTDRATSSCPVVQLMTWFLRDKRVMDAVEEVVYIRIPPITTVRGLQSFIPDTGKLSKLRSIRFPASWSPSCVSIRGPSEEIMRDFFNAAPQLETLDLEWSRYKLSVLADCGKYELLRNFRLQPYDDWEQETWEFILSQQPRLERLSASTDDGDIPASVLGDLRLILQSSAKTLKILRLDLSLLATLRSAQTRPLENLRTLEIGLNHRWYRDKALVQEIRCLNLTRLLPKIESITIYRTIGGQRRIPLPLLVADATEDDTGDASGILKLNTTGDSLNYSDDIARMVKLFPNVTSLTLTVGEHWKCNYVNLWWSWMHLTSASITQSVSNPKFNLDAEFCGVFPAEVAFLQEQDDEFLKSYHLVSIKPALLLMKALVRLHITLRLHRDPGWPVSLYSGNPNFFLSKVTGHLVLSRTNHLTVTVGCDSLKALKHLGAFVKLVKTGDDDDGAGSSDEEQS